MVNHMLLEEMRQAVEGEMRRSLDQLLIQEVPEFSEMLEYQLGMDRDHADMAGRGKRLRPLLLLASSYAVAGQWKHALPAAAAVELMHNFSLIHDDIQDKSNLRRGRPTVWVKWGIAQAINAGDAMLGLSQLELLDSLENIHAGVAIQVSRLFNQTLVELTRGQYLDLTFEQRETVTVQQYEWMTTGKTGALIAACTETGALLGGADLTQGGRMREFGRLLGRAFQIQDDWMGIWGDEELTCKSIHSDLVERKKTYPVILGLNAGGAFAQEWRKFETITNDVADHLASLLADDGIKAKTESSFMEDYDRALQILAEVPFDERLKRPLQQLAQSIMTRVK